jgi:hypothetical protein
MKQVCVSTKAALVLLQVGSILKFVHFRLTSLADVSIFSKRAATAATARTLEVKSDYFLFPSYSAIIDEYLLFHK